MLHFALYSGSSTTNGARTTNEAWSYAELGMNVTVTALISLACAVAVVGCARSVENRTGTDWTTGQYNVNEVPLEESSGDIPSASSLFCGESRFSPEAGFCATDVATCSRVNEQIAVRSASEPAQCHPSTTAVCYVTTTDGKDRFVCGPSERACKFQREKERARNAFNSIGECVEQHPRGKAR